MDSQEAGFFPDLNWDTSRSSAEREKIDNNDDNDNDNKGLFEVQIDIYIVYRIYKVFFLNYICTHRIKIYSRDVFVLTQYNEIMKGNITYTYTQ